MRYTDFVLRNARLSLFLAPFLVAGCGGGTTLPTGPSPVASAVEFHYEVSGAPAGALALDCVGRVHLHPSWWGFAQVNMADVGSDTWAILFESVPVGRHTVRVEVPPECGTGEVSANGTMLTDRVPSKRGVELGFTVHADGSVTP